MQQHLFTYIYMFTLIYLINLCMCKYIQVYIDIIYMLQTTHTTLTFILWELRVHPATHSVLSATLWEHQNLLVIFEFFKLGVRCAWLVFFISIFRLCAILAVMNTVSLSLSLSIFLLNPTGHEQQITGLWGLDLLLVSSHRGDFPGQCRTLLLLEAQLAFPLIVQKRFETPLDVI